MSTVTKLVLAVGGSLAAVGFIYKLLNEDRKRLIRAAVSMMVFGFLLRLIEVIGRIISDQIIGGIEQRFRLDSRSAMLR